MCLPRLDILWVFEGRLSRWRLSLNWFPSGTQNVSVTLTCTWTMCLIVLVVTLCTHYIVHGCNHIPDKKQFQINKVCFGSQQEREAGVGMKDGKWTHCLYNQETEDEQEVGPDSETSRPASVTHFLQPYSTSYRCHNLPRQFWQLGT